MKKSLTQRSDILNVHVPSGINSEKAFSLLSGGGSGRTFYFSFHCDEKYQFALGNAIVCNEITEWHNHDFYEINYVFKGRVYQIVNQNKICLRAGDMLIMHPSVHHTLTAVDGTVAMNLLLKAELVENTANSFTQDTVLDEMMRKKSFFVMNMSKNREWKEFLGQFRKHNNIAFTKNSEYAVYQNELARLLLMTIILNGKQNKDAVLLREYDDKNKNPAQRIIEYACENFATVSVAELSRKFSYSRMQIHRFFLKHTGYDFSDYISVLRYERAVSLLVHSDLSIAQISEILGLERNYFCRFFKAKFTVTPTQYRRYARENKL